MNCSIRSLYEQQGVASLYTSGEYTNPHKDVIQEMVYHFANLHYIVNCDILDLCCGNGEVTEVLSQCNNLVGCDPYMHEVYTRQTGLKCFDYSFDDIAFKENIDFSKYNYIFCSYALHLCEQSKMYGLMYKLSTLTDNLVIISPSDVILERVHRCGFFKMVYSAKLNRTHLFHFKVIK